MSEGDKYEGCFTITPKLDLETIKLINLIKVNHPSLHWKLDSPNSELEYSTLSWDGFSNFQKPEEWIEYLITNLKPRGFTINGKVKWFGPGHPLDAGYIKVVNNVVSGGMLYI